MRPDISARAGISIDEYPLEKCIVPGICVDLRHIAPRAEIAPADLEAAVAKSRRARAEGRHRAALHRSPRTKHSPARNIRATILA